MQVKFRTNEKLIEFFIKNNLMNEYAFFLKLKTYHDNGNFFNYSPASLAKLTGVGEGRIRRFVKKLEKFGLIQIISHKNGKRLLQCISLTQIQYSIFNKLEFHRCSIMLSKEDSLRDITDQLFNKLFQKQAEEAIFAEDYNRKKEAAKVKLENCKFNPNNFVNDQLSSETGRQISKLKPSNCPATMNRIFEKFFIDSEAERLHGRENVPANSIGPYRGHKMLSEYNNRFIIGYRKLAENIGISLSCAWNIVKRLKDKGLIYTETIKMAIRQMNSEAEFNNMYEELMEDYQGYVYYNTKSGFAELCLGTIFDFSDFPVTSNYGKIIRVDNI